MPPDADYAGKIAFYKGGMFMINADIISAKTISTEKLVLPEMFRSKIPVCDQETTVNTFRNDDYAVIYTSDNTMLTKLRNLQKANPQAYQVVRVFWMEGEPSGVEVKFPKKFLSFRTAGKLPGIEEEVDE